MMRKKILVLGTYINAPYHPMGGVDDCLRAILPDVELVFTDDPERLDANPLDGFAGIISYLDQWDRAISADAANLLKSLVEGSGLGLLVLHSGICLAKEPSMYELIGGEFTEHPAQEPLTFYPAGNSLLSGIPAFTVREEPYRFRREAAGAETILAYLYHGEIWPAGWRREAGRGRVCFLCPGHTEEAFAIPAYGEMIRRALSWVLR